MFSTARNNFLIDRVRSKVHLPLCLVLALCIMCLVTLHHTRAEGKPVTFAAFGDYGTSGSVEAKVAAMIATWNPDFIITTGDNSYRPHAIDRNVGKSYSNYIGAYHGKYGTGADTNRFFPCPGNHDYDNKEGIGAYLAYFTLPGENISSSLSSGTELYYDFVQGPIHFFSINSNVNESDGITKESRQAQWLKEQLGQSTSRWNIIYFHHPPYSSSSVHGSNTAMRWPFEDWGATAVLNGHAHTYERILRDDNKDGNYMPYFITGLGGRNSYHFSKTPVKGSQLRFNSSHGAMLVHADDTSISFSFYSIKGGGSGTLIDSVALIDTSAIRAARSEIQPDTLQTNFSTH